MVRQKGKVGRAGSSEVGDGTADHRTSGQAPWLDRGDLGLREAEAEARPGLQGLGESVGVVGMWLAQPGQWRPILGCPGQSSVT